tara:strand:+ start:403 stop:4128 length:3726 start_codon:yes stop_codon:yes gene_type:complete
MAQFSPSMTREELVNQFRPTTPAFNNMSDDKAYRHIIRKYPQYKLNQEEVEYKPANPKDKNLFDSMPDWLKDGYNRSLQGMSQEIATGNKRFDLSGYDPGVIEDLGAGIASFFAPLDFATTIAGGGIGGAATKSLVKKYVFKKLVRNGALKTTAGKAAIKASTFASTSGSGAGALGLYSGAGEALNEKIVDGTISPGKVVKASAKGALLGGMTGYTNAFLTQKGANTLTKVAAEVGEFGTVAPLLEGEIPTPQDYVHAGGMILGIKGVNKLGGEGIKRLQSYVKEARKPEFTWEIMPKDQPGRAEIYKTESELQGLKSQAKRRAGEIYTDRKGREIEIKKEGDKEIQARFLDTNELSQIPKDIFTTEYRLKEQIALTPKELRDTRSKEIRKLEKELGHEKKVKETSRAMLIEKTEVPKKPLLKNVDNKGLRKIREDLLLELDVKKALENIERTGVRMIKPRQSLLTANILPERVSKLLDILRPAKNQGTADPIRRAYVGKFDSFLTDNRRVMAESHDIMQRGGFTAIKPTKEQVASLSKALGLDKADVSKNYWELLTDAVENGINTPETMAHKQFMNYLFNKAKESGVDASGYIDNYAPQILKQGVAEKIFGDINKMSGRIFEGSKRSRDIEVNRVYNAKQEVIDDIIQAMNNPEGFAKDNSAKARFLNKMVKRMMPSLEGETNLALKSILESGSKLGELSHYKAMALMGRMTYGDVFRLDGNLEKAREFKLPKELYERDIRALQGIYSSNVARRASEVKHFGREGEIKTALVRNAKTRDAEIINELHSHVLGTISHNRAYNFNPSVKNFMEKVMEWETATKIGLGTASAMNLSQFTISSAFSAGYWRFAKGAYKYNTDKKFRAQVDASGANLYKYINEMMELSPQDSISRKIVTKITDVSQFNRINSINNILAAASARVLVDDLVAIVSGKAKLSKLPGRKKWAIGTLRKMGIDPNTIKGNKISETSMLDAIGKFAIDSQLQKNLLNDPLVLNRPILKPFLQFKSFGYRQYNFIKDTLKHDVIHHNYMPLLRLAGAGFATGAISLKAKELMKYLASGEMSYDPSTFGTNADVEDIIENVAAVGAFGFLGDFMTAALEEGRTFSQALKFMAQPAFLSDVSNFHGFIEAMERDYKNYQGDFIKRVPSRIFKMTGSPLLKDFSKRLETDNQTKERIEFLRGRRKSAIVDSLIKSSTNEDYQKAIEDIKDWNRAYRMFPINITDINYKAIIKRKLNKLKKRQEV